MFITKDGATMELTNDNHIAAFLSSGWVEAKATAHAAEEANTEADVDFMPAPVVEAEEKPEVVVAPKRGRKKAGK